MKIFGVDFTSAPCRRKAITVAAGRLKGMTLAIQGIERLETFSAFEALLARPGPSIGGSDFSFGPAAPRCPALGRPHAWEARVSHCPRPTPEPTPGALAALRNSSPTARE